MPRIVVTRRTYGSLNGRDCQWYNVGETYDLPTGIGRDGLPELGAVFLAQGWGHLESEVKAAPVQPAEPEIEEEEEEAAVEEPSIFEDADAIEETEETEETEEEDSARARALTTPPQPLATLEKPTKPVRRRG